MNKIDIGIIEFRGKKSFDTKEEALDFANSLGNRCRYVAECKYPDITFYVVEFDGV